MVPAPADVLEIFLQPGDFYFGDENTRIRTLLGSCVAVVLWHPRQRIGGMCHYMLPSRPGEADPGTLDGRYADDAMQMFLQELRRTGTSPAHYRVKLVGGGRMFEGSGPASGVLDVARRNVAAARALMAEHGFHIQGDDLGGACHRNVVFDLWSGDIWLKRVPRTVSCAG